MFFDFFNDLTFIRQIRVSYILAFFALLSFYERNRSISVAFTSATALVTNQRQIANIRLIHQKPYLAVRWIRKVQYRQQTKEH